MEELTLILKNEDGSGIQSIGFDVVWNDADFQFVGFQKLAGAFDVCDAALADGQQGRIVVAASQIEGELLGSDYPFVTLQFEPVGALNDVQFAVENLTAEDAEGRQININMNVADFLAPGGTWDVDWLWKKKMQ